MFLDKPALRAGFFYVCLGWNPVLFKILNGLTGMGLYFRVMDEAFESDCHFQSQKAARLTRYGSSSYKVTVTFKAKRQRGEMNRNKLTAG